MLSLTVAASGALLAAAAAQLSGSPFQLLIGAAVFTLVFLASLLLRLRRLPDLHATAQLADRHFGLQERLSSALEASESPRQRALFRLLIDDAAAQLKRVDAAELVTYRLDRKNLLTLAASALVATAAFLLTMNGAVTGPDLTAGGSTPGQQTADAAASANAPLTADSELLNALAPTVSDLAQAEPPEAAEPESSQVGEPGPDAGAPEPADPTEADGQRSATDTERADSTATPGADELPLADASARPEDFHDGESARDFMEPDPNLLRRLEERRQQMLADTAGMEVASLDSSAQQSDRGAGDPGGDGPDSSLAAGPEEVEFGFGDAELELAAEELLDGGRTTTQASPDTVFTDSGDTGLTTGGFSRTTEAPVQQAALSAAHLAVVRDYFLPAAE